MAEVKHHKKKIETEKKKNNNITQQQYINPSNSINVPNVKNDKVTYKITEQQGVTGLNRFGNFVSEEFLPELHGSRGAAKYREMMDNDATIGATMHSVKSLVRNVDWRIEAAGTTDQDKEAAQFVESCMHDMDMSWSDILSDILSFIGYGYCFMETSYKIRRGPDKSNMLNMYKGSKYNDGRIGWSNWGIRSQNTLWGWNFNDDNSLNGMIQLAPPHFKTTLIPMDKSLLFRTESNKNNPEGRSLLRSAYRSWSIKKNLEDIEAIGMEKDLTGMPIMWIPPEILAAGNNPDATPEEVAALQSYKQTVTNLKRNEQSGLLMPLVYDDQGRKLYDVTTLEGGSTRKQFDTDQVIKRYDRNIAMTLLADFLLLGTNSQGSFALSDNKTSLFKTSLNTILKIICDEINRVAIPRLMRLNNFDKLTDYPRLIHGKVDEANLTELANYLGRLAQSGVIDSIGDTNLEEFTRDKAGLPPRPDNQTTPDIGLDNGGSGKV